MEYNKDPYDIDHKKITVDYVYNLAIKKLMGHTVSDATKGVYIHRDVKYLVEAIKLIY